MNDIQLSKNFRLSEFISSGFATKYQIDNTPNEEELQNIQTLVTTVLQPIRDEFGEPIIVSSGFRCERVNNGVGGVKNSDHRFGSAADIKACDGLRSDNMRLWQCIMRMLKEGKLKCRQIIWEHGRKKIGPDWLHISINNNHNSYKDNQLVYIGVK